jgi:hypothetical protein
VKEKKHHITQYKLIYTALNILLKIRYGEDIGAADNRYLWNG